MSKLKHRHSLSVSFSYKHTIKTELNKNLGSVPLNFLFPHRWSAKLRADAGAILAGEGVSTDPAAGGKCSVARHGRRGSRKYKRRFFSRPLPQHQQQQSGVATGSVRRRGPRRLSGSNHAPFNSTQFLMNDRGSESIRYLDDKLDVKKGSASAPGNKLDSLTKCYETILIGQVTYIRTPLKRERTVYLIHIL